MAALALQAAHALSCWLAYWSPGVSLRDELPPALPSCAAWHNAALVGLCAYCRACLARRRRPVLLQACAGLLLLDATLCAAAVVPALTVAIVRPPSATGALAHAVVAAVTGLCELAAAVAVLQVVYRPDVRQAFR